MAKILQLTLLVGCSLLVGSSYADDECEPAEKVVFCYYSSWAVYRPTFGKYAIENIDPHLCTHIAFAFAGLNLDGLTFSLDAANDLPESGGMGQYYKFRMLKEQNPCVKLMLSIGGWDEGSEKYSVMAETEESRSKFVEHLLRYLIYYGFDGVDLDWEYPAARGGIADDKENYVKLLTLMRQRLGARHKVIAVAVGASSTVLENGYDVPRVAELVDYVLLMAYDYHRPKNTSYVAPLRKRDGDINDGSIENSIRIWLNNGCPPEKMVLGVVSSGRSYTLKNATENGLGAEVTGPGKMGNYTGIDGFISYYEICLRIAEGGWRVVADDFYANNYMTKGDQWITYDDAKSVTQKTAFAVSMNLGGMMVWSIDTDDFRGFCEKNSLNQLQKTIRKELGME